MPSSRKRRALPTNIRCRLALVADFRFFNEMGQSSRRKTINYMVGSIKFYLLAIYSGQQLFLRLFCRMQNSSLVRKREFTPLVGHKLLFVFPLTNAQLHLTKRKMSSNGSANVKHSEAMSDEIVTAMSTACGASIFLFELFKKKPRKHLLS